MLEGAILFVGLGSNKYKLDEIVSASSLSDIGATYGTNSCFYEAILAARQISSSDLDMYILNLDSWEGIKAHSEEIADLDIDYLVPLDLYLNETYYDEFYDKNLSFTQLILSFLSRTVTTVIITGKHASNFETLDDYLAEENERIEDVRPELVNVNKENLVYVANNLTGVKYANAVLAAMLVNADYAEYPINSSLPEAVFDIDYADVDNELAYFRNHYNAETSVENLVNFSDQYGIKPITVKRVLKYFHYHPLDMTKYLGQAYTEYKKVKIAEELDNYLSKLVNWIIYDYNIYSVSDVSYEPGSVDILLKFDIWPKFTTEKFSLSQGG